MRNMVFVAREMTRVPTFVSRCTKIMHTSHGEWEALRSQSVWSSMVSCLLRCGVDGGLSLAVLAIAVEVIATWVLFTIDPSGVLSRRPQLIPDKIATDCTRIDILESAQAVPPQHPLPRLLLPQVPPPPPMPLLLCPTSRRASLLWRRGRSVAS